MAERKRVTLIYSYNVNWIGGTYYIINIVKALNKLDDIDKPELEILHDEDSSIKMIEDISYPYIEYTSFKCKLSNFKRVINKAFYYLNGEIPFKIELPSKYLDNLYPLNRFVNYKSLSNHYYWIPDFQERYMPQFFSKYELRQRKIAHTLLVESKTSVVFSSKMALEDFNNFYPNNVNSKYILQFTSIIDEDYHKINVEKLLKKYNINFPYFIVPNQFWKHKNHDVVLKAIKLLKDKTDSFQIVFTGKEHDYRNPDHVSNLKKYVSENSLEDTVLFLGFVDRNEQLQLMKNSVSIIQPSLFEGWSTVVEDAKALNKFVILSDIILHREQIEKNCKFFLPNDYVELSKIMIQTLNSNPIPVEIDYDTTIRNFAKTFLSIFSK
jgi:glycosyltransferase involved in cell wall biosynthesis